MITEKKGKLEKEARAAKIVNMTKRHTTRINKREMIFLAKR